MSRFVLVLAALLPLAAAAQEASKQQVDAVSSVAECLAIGLPRQWKQLLVVIELQRPLAETGAVRYQVTLPDDSNQPFEPCDPNLAPVKLLALRDGQEEKERRWTMLILTMKPDASFNIKYEYPQPKKKN
jgi:hypothetical protein